MRIYLDHNATTPVREEVRRAMADALDACWGNPSSPHAEGAAARRALDVARAQAAALLGCAPRDLMFTGSATEANNTVVHGVTARARGPHLLGTKALHPSLLAPLCALAEAGAATLDLLPVDAEGRLAPETLRAALRADTALVCVLLANNETGVLQDVAALAEVAHARGVPLHVDATQAVGKMPVDAAALGADWLSASAHKFNGPKGVGLLLTRGPFALPAFVHGGPQEKRRRGGTENLPGIVGLGVACELAQRELPSRSAHTRALRDQLWRGIRARLPDARRNGHPGHALGNTLNVEFPGCDGEALLQALDGEGVAASAGAACASGSIEPSSVLLAMGRTPAEARASLRFSLGPSNTEAEIERVLALLPKLLRRVQSARPSADARAPAEAHA